MTCRHPLRRVNRRNVCELCATLLNRPENDRKRPAMVPEALWWAERPKTRKEVGNVSR